MEVKKIVIALLVSLSPICLAFGADGHGAWIDSEKRMEPLPNGHGTAGAFSGTSNGAMIVAGGTWFDGDSRIYDDAIHVYHDDGDGLVWESSWTLPSGIGHGASVQTPDGILCLGGETADGLSNGVFSLSWDAMSNIVRVDSTYPSLPSPRAGLSAAAIDKSVYVVSGKDFWRFDLVDKQWKELPGVPFEPRDGMVLLSQSNGVNTCLYAIGGKGEGGLKYYADVWRYDPSLPEGSRWSRQEDAPYPLSFAPATTYGSSYLLLFSGSTGSDTNGDGEFRFPTGVLTYNTITNAWCHVADLAQGVVCANAVKWNGAIVIPGGEVRPRERTPEVVALHVADKKEKAFGFWDYVTLIGYMALIVILSVGFSRKTKSSKDFFLGGQKIPFWAAGLSLMAAQVSSIGFMSIPAKSFATNWSYFAGVLTWFIVVPIVVYVFVPFYRKLNVTSAYEYLEKRFNKFIRKFIAFLYLLFQLLGRLGALIFLPAIALSAVTGISPIVSIVLIGGLATLYTFLGGMKAVIWIDVLQALVLFAAIFICIGFVLANTDGGISTVIDVARDNGKFSFGRMDWDVTGAVLWVIVIGNIFNRLGTNATDQSVVQRYLTTKNEKDTAKALWTDAFVSIPWALCVFGLGTALFVFYKLNPGMLNPTVANDEIVPFFIGQNLPTGLRGLVIAGIFAASMSSVDSSVHSSTTVIFKDFLWSRFRDMDERGKVKYARMMTLVIGLLGTLIAVVMTFWDINSVWDIILEVAGLFTGAMSGVFLLGIFFKKANSKGAIVGALASSIILFAVKTWTPVNFFLYSGIGIVSCVVIGLIASYFFKSDKLVEGLTIDTVGK